VIIPISREREHFCQYLRMDEKQLYSCITWQLLFLYPGQQRTKYCLLINLCYIIFNQIWVPKLILFMLHSQNLNSTDHRHRIDTLIANQTARTALPPTTAKSGNHKMADCPSLFLPNQSQRIAFSTLTLLAGRQEGHPASKKNWVVEGCWCGYLSGARCRLAYGRADANATHCLLLQ